MQKNLLLSVFLCMILGLALPGWSQVQNASLTGLVTDASGAVVAGASVMAKNNSTNTERKTSTDSSGYYIFPAIDVGTYTVSVEMAGFKKAIQDNVLLQVAQRGRVDFKLDVGMVTQTVEVKGSAAALQTEDAATGEVVQNRMVLDIPLGMRNWDDLLGLIPGVTGDRYTEQSGSTASGRTGGVNVHGVRSLQNNFLLDGIDNNTISENVQELSTQVVHESIDALQEFKVITDPYSAEYGRSPGSSIVAVTKNGTNQFHGTLWEFVRNDKFDAADWFLNRSGGKKAENRTNYFGGNVGGPIVKNRAFFFFNYEGNRIIRGQTRLTNTPTASERQGDFSSATAALLKTSYANVFDRVGDCVAKDPTYFSASDPLGPTHFTNNVIPSACLDTEVQSIVAGANPVLPLPNVVPGSGALNANNYLRVPGLLDNNDAYTARVDANVSQNNHVFVRFAYSNRLRFLPGYFGGLIDGTGTSAYGRTFLKAGSAALGWTTVISPRILNEVRIGWGRNNSLSQQDPFGKSTLAGEGILGIADSSYYDGGYPGMVISGGGGVPQPAGGGGGGRLGSPDFLPKFQKTNQFEEVDTLSIARGTHQLKLGVDFHFPMRDIYLDVPGVRGTWTFNGVYSRNPATGASNTGIPWADFLLGVPQSAQLTGLSIFDERLWMAGFFFQDSWKATSKLTVNYGVRYDYATWPYEAAGRQSNLNLATGLWFVGPANSPYGKSLVNPDKKNFAPRLSLAYHVSTNWVLRAGYGRFYQLFERSGSEDQLEENLPQLVNNVLSGSSTVPANNMRVVTGFNLPLVASLVNPVNVHDRAVNPQDVHPSTDQWNLGFQRLFGQNTTLTVDYVGTKGTHLSILRQLNQEFLNPNNTPTAVLPYPGYGPVEYRDNMGNATYESVEATMERRFSRGLTFTASYVYSHSIDWAVDNLFGGGSGSIVPDTWDVRGTNRGNSDFDTRHQVKIGYVYELPSPFKKSMGAEHVASYILRDWRVSGFTTGRTGHPYSIFANNNKGALDIRGGLISDVYADCLGNGSLSSSQGRTVTHWINTADYVLPSPARMGTCGRDNLFGPDLIQFDINLTRSIVFKESKRVEFRWDMLNAFNNTHFGLPTQDVSSGTFGQIAALSGDPRVMQFALKFYF